MKVFFANSYGHESNDSSSSLPKRYCIVRAFLMLVRSMSVNSAPGAIVVGVAVGVAPRMSLETILPSIPVPWISWTTNSTEAEEEPNMDTSLQWTMRTKLKL